MTTRANLPSVYHLLRRRNATSRRRAGPWRSPLGEPRDSRSRASLGRPSQSLPLPAAVCSPWRCWKSPRGREAMVSKTQIYYDVGDSPSMTPSEQPPTDRGASRDSVNVLWLLPALTALLPTWAGFGVCAVSIPVARPGVFSAHSLWRGCSLGCAGLRPWHFCIACKIAAAGLHRGAGPADAAASAVFSDGALGRHLSLSMGWTGAGGGLNPMPGLLTRRPVRVKAAHPSSLRASITASYRRSIHRQRRTCSGWLRRRNDGGSCVPGRSLCCGCCCGFVQRPTLAYDLDPVTAAGYRAVVKRAPDGFGVLPWRVCWCYVAHRAGGAPGAWVLSTGFAGRCSLSVLVKPLSLAVVPGRCRRCAGPSGDGHSSACSGGALLSGGAGLGGPTVRRVCRSRPAWANTVVAGESTKGPTRSCG